jgi:hypothetical protein
MWLFMTGSGIMTANGMWLVGADWMRGGVLLGLGGWRLPYGEEMRFLCSGASKLGRSLTEFVSPVLL